jgi:hypothetical protein
MRAYRSSFDIKDADAVLELHSYVFTSPASWVPLHARSQDDHAPHAVNKEALSLLSLVLTRSVSLPCMSIFITPMYNLSMSYISVAVS